MAIRAAWPKGQGQSHNPVAGDAHYTAGGSFSIEQLDGLPGNLLSPHDQIILALR
ncbi:MAG: hypothetical protein F6K50_08390 [Moorea sp. SIO3I7]|uniref:hypothetical protein n=1 Tax=Moorena sp. SIO3I8 TaxID=2607833 RepID=UPI0013C0C319|nr:hypothetical protein [Moorena sp. SIO3I8]NEN95542.1 hypothetical protein [Moorena sp. SIO3I7]NEO10166.1 hypothetical protein [Moorena sp. SIO3I8]